MRTRVLQVVVVGCSLLAGGVALADPSGDAIVFPPYATDNAVAQTAPAHGSWSRLTGSWLDFDALYGTFDFQGQRFDTEVMRFGPRVSIGRYLYFGAELDVGHFDNPTAITSKQTQPIALVSGGGSSSGNTEAFGADHGTVAMGKVVAGGHLMFGPLSAGLELAGGVSDVMTYNRADENMNGGFDTIWEGHARIDAWLSPHLSVGALGSVDLSDRGEASLGVALGWHFIRYDGLR